MSVTGSIIAGVGAAASIGGAAIGSSASQNAAQTQAQAANEAAVLQQQDAAASIQQQEQALNLAQQDTASQRAVGQNALLAQNDLMGLTPVAPQPINAGGNAAPIPGGINGQPAVTGQINNPAAPPGPYSGAPSAPSSAPPQPAPTVPVALPQPGDRGFPTPRAMGGPVVPRMNSLAQHYIVGEKGPEELTMFPNGTGWVTPHSGLSRMAAIHRAGGGPVGGVGPGGAAGSGPVSTASTNALYPGGVSGAPVVAGPGASTGGRPANPIPQGPYGGGNAGNPLINGGSTTPIQNTPFTQWSQQFQAPTAAQAEQYPGYQFQLQQGEQALTNQASATGELGDSNYGRALTNYAEGAAQSDYGNVYNQAMQQYDQNYNIFNNNQNTQFNRLSALSGAGQTSTNQLNATNQVGASNIGNTLLQSGQQIGQQLNNAGAATASGYVGSANAWGGALGGVGNAASTIPYLNYLGQQGTQGFDPTIDSSSWSNF